MRERLLIVGIVCALVVGGWAGVYAATACAHAARASSPAAASHDCCRGHGGGESASCPMKSGASRGASHATKERAHAATPDAKASQKLRVGALARRAALCAHCVGSRLPPPPSNRLAAPEAAKRGDAGSPPRAERLPAAAPPAFVREVIPSQGAPPARARLHVLHSVFLI